MPKKRSFNFKAIQGSSSNTKPSNSADGEKKTVNERLGELRKVEAKDAAQKKRELAEAVSQRSVPAHLRSILGQAESAPPKPKRGVRSRVPNRTPGPAPPKSWAEKPAWTPMLALRGGRRSFKRNGSTNDSRCRSNELFRFGRMTGEESEGVNQPMSSLLHISLKIAAEQWLLFDEEDLPALAEMPLRLRLRLLSYIGFYGPTIGKKTLDALTTGSDPVRFLDLSGLAGHGSLTLPRLAKFLRDAASDKATRAEVEEIAETWDNDGTLEAALIPQPFVSRFAHLSHLSLSHPPPGTSSWKDLLALSKQIQSVTHLSLAYWARPTLTPNLATVTVSSQYSPDVSAGGSNYYSDIDHDLSEPATILRQLSGNLLRLQWLDLEGCTEWFPALAYEGERIWDFPLAEAGERGSWSRTPVVLSIFAQHWKNLQYLNCAQGWLPTLEGLHAQPRQTMPLKHRQMMDDFLEKFDAFEQWKNRDEERDVYEVEKRRANIWLQRESEAWETQKRINDTRRRHACRPMTIDHGWERKTFR